MRRTLVLLSFAAVAIASCKKKSENTATPLSMPTYTVDGIHDLTITYNSTTRSMVVLPVTVQYQDSLQRPVTLSLSELPAGITMDNDWVTTGYPTFSTVLTFYDTSANKAANGTYPLTLTASGSAGAKTYTFNLKVVEEQSCSADIIDNYSDCNSNCSGFYRDTIYADASVTNKIWFKNFDRTGKKVYAMYKCADNSFIIPPQVVDGEVFSGKGFYVYASGSTGRLISINLKEGNTSCTLTMR